MRGVLLGSALAVAVPSLVLPAVASAATEGFYVGAGAGVNWTRDADVRSYPAPGFGLTEDFKIGGIGDLSAGYATAMGLRAELETAWRWRNRVDDTSSATPALNGVDGKMSSIAFMGNLLYDFKFGLPITPYIGVGAGVAGVKQTLGGQSDRDWVFAYQGIVGASYDITDNLAVTLDYRYFATTDPEFDLGPASSKGEYRNHTILAGLRYSFGGPARPTPVAAPAPVPAPVQAQPQTEYQVFFDWDKSTITPTSEKIIADAADAAGRVRAVNIQVIGHTDTSGSPAYNQRLSLRRAEAVRRALIARGTPANMIRVDGVGENQLMVPTGPNVREPSNRRAQILIKVS
ncbi:OmpA family protein [Azospirillum picis]|uniref:Outer membrane protein OmpA-like peptidoglycan-associated protein n=2 Tax=Azospirillum picis TaxID=488438 RepID=A0ABU0MP45_9PROT|nr:OmpA family protein [Azospirillum picis]MBP2301407.1 outer membrane protein OmpA-like peptidoglycan-associated protein [Azospirillum picis]MDQ0535238.1 outer membrane protein OmpA-like peptidoglycan-associated protein [Azospirillum picis]